MSRPTIDLRLDGDGAWPDLEDRPIIHLTDIGMSGLRDGMKGGGPSIVFRLDLPDGQTVIAETSLGLLESALNALKIAFRKASAGSTFGGPSYGN